jgi:hypothetical protein
VTFVANGDVAGFLREMVDLVQSEPAHVASAATSVVAERKHGLASQILAFDELLENVTLGSFEFPCSLPFPQKDSPARFGG